MDFSVVEILIILLLIGFAMWISQRTERHMIEQDCTCDKGLDKCLSSLYVKSSSRGMLIKRDTDEMFKCGRVQEQLKEANKVFNVDDNIDNQKDS